jgi:hypothetical protein
MSNLTVLLYLHLRYRHPELNGVYNFGTVLGWSCRVYVPVSELIYAAFLSNAKVLLPPSDEWRRRGL